MENPKAKKFKLWYQIFMVVGLLGLIDVATRGAVQQSYNLTDIGYISIGSFFLFKFLFGTKVAATLSTIISTIFGFSIVWLILGYFMNQKSKFIENPSDENKKKYKTSKTVAWIFGGIILTIMIFTMFLTFYQS